MKKETVMRNPIAKNAWKFNRATVVMPRKGKGSFKRRKEVKDND
jgi:stalled ribosome alternative rescue factor ArfA